jgi:hypothetical protein
VLSEHGAGFETCDTAGLEACATGQCQDAPGAFLAKNLELTALPRQEQRDGAIQDRVEAMKRGKVNSQGSDFHLVQETVRKAKGNSVACGYLTQPPTK